MLRTRAEYGIDEKSVCLGRGPDGKKTGEAPCQGARGLPSRSFQCLPSTAFMSDKVDALAFFAGLRGHALGGDRRAGAAGPAD